MLFWKYVHACDTHLIASKFVLLQTILTKLLTAPQTFGEEKTSPAGPSLPENLKAEARRTKGSIKNTGARKSFIVTMLFNAIPPERTRRSLALSCA